ncbi:MAG: hypothetical protein GY816_08470 [Cytophagales bacterium]|nr:hypothetical protein [Cytophagales bacterium]
MKVVKQKFSQGPPNGWLLGWDEERFFPDFIKIAHPFLSINLTSFDYSFCNKFHVRSDTNEIGQYLALTVCLSFIVDAYSIHWTFYDYKGRTGKVVPSPCKEPESILEYRIREFLAKQGFVEIPDNWYNAKVEGVHLDLSDDEHVILGKCLFDDFDG